MKSIRHSYTVLLLAVLSMMATACQKEEKDRTVNLRVEADDAPNGGKTYVSDNYICWHHGDQVNINGTAYSLSVTGTNSVTASISGVAKSESGYTAAYPAGRVSSPSSSSVTFTIPAEQTYTTLTTPTGSAQVLEMPMVGQCGQNDGVLKFRNAASIIAVTVDAGYEVFKVMVTTGSTNICGIGSVNPGNTEPSLSITSDGGQTVTLDCSSSYPAASSTPLYLVVAPFENQNINVEVWARDATTKAKYTKTKASSSTKTLRRNEMAAVHVSMSEATAKEFFGGDGSSEANAWLITDDYDLAQMRTKVNGGTTGGCYRQTADITVSENPWVAIGTSAKRFQGTYDGGNKIVTLEHFATETSIYGFFGYVDGATLKNLTVDGSSAFNNQIYIGGICGVSVGTTTFENCENRLPINNSANYTGGICGWVYSGTVSFNNCRNEADIFGGTCSGGIAGGVDGSNGSVTFTDCSNNGTLSGSSNVGGLIGELGYASSSGSFSVNVEGTTENRKTVRGTGQYIGGVIGYIKYCSSITISGTVTNSDSITGPYNVGGIVGYNTNSGVLTIGSSSSDRIVNDAAVLCSGTNASSQSFGTGGIVGCSNGTISVQYCKNNGRIYGKKYRYSGEEKGGTGGIIGYCASGSTIDYCSNTNDDITALDVNHGSNVLQRGSITIYPIVGLVTYMSSCTHPFPGL